MLRVLLLLSFMMAGAPSTNANILPVEYFAKRAQFDNLKLSPDGKHFAATVPKEGTTNLVIINRASMKVVRAYGFGLHEHIRSFFWANSERLVYEKAYKTPSKEKLIYKGELFAANIDGSKRVQLFGSSSSNSSSAFKRGIQAWGYIIHTLPEDEEHILVKSSKWSTDSDSPDKIYKINIYNQKRTLITKMPIGNIEVIIDKHGNPIIASGKDRAGKKRKYFYQKQQWQEIPKDHELLKYSFLAVNHDASILYLSKSVDRGTRGLYQYNFNSKEISLLFHHDTVDYAGLIKAPGTKSIIGVKTMFDGVDYHYLDNKHPYTKIHRQLAATFPESDISIYANSKQDSEMIVKTTSDKNPGEFYLYNQAEQSIKFLISKHPWIKPSQMSSRKLIQFTARDGATIFGYLTMPVNHQSPAPLIVDVHGGPFGVQDKWHYNSDAQMWANNGYAVLQINFRGSGGYGKRYKHTAYKKRSTLIQYDIIDGTKWALNLSNIDNEKVCIIGGSFGGYSALMAPLIEPELYKCAIPRYGSYDLVYQMSHADYMSKDSVSVGAMEKYGNNEKIWREQSPLTYIDKLTTPLMIVTGGKDKRVPPQNAFNLKAALDERNIEYEWLYKEKEGHGFINEENKIELYKKSLAFVKKHLN